MASRKSSEKERPEAAAPQSEPKVVASDKPEIMQDPEATKDPETMQDPKPAPAPPVPKGPAVLFRRWFQAKGFKDHWRGGMEAFADTNGRRTIEEWDTVFKNY